MWKRFFQQNQTNKNKINAATVDKAIRILEHCSTEIVQKRKKNKTTNQQRKINIATTNNKITHKVTSHPTNNLVILKGWIFF